MSDQNRLPETPYFKTMKTHSEFCEDPLSERTTIGAELDLAVHNRHECDCIWLKCGFVALLCNGYGSIYKKQEFAAALEAEIPADADWSFELDQRCIDYAGEPEGAAARAEITQAHGEFRFD